MKRDEALRWLAQAVFNINEGHTNIEPDSLIYKALNTLCRLEMESPPITKIAPDTQLWIVTDPTPVSGISDICYETKMRGLENFIIGGAQGQTRMTDSNMTIYTDAKEAHEDAEDRMDITTTFKAIDKFSPMAVAFKSVKKRCLLISPQRYCNASGYVRGDTLRDVWKVAKMFGYGLYDGDFSVDKYGSLWVTDEH